MGFVHGCQYTKDQTFAEAQLLELTPDHVSKHFNMLAHGKQVPGPNDKPNKCRHTNLEQVKKAVSYFHPNKLQPWNAQAKCGNPTRSVPVNDVIKEVKRAEVRKQGVPSRAKRDLKRQEFRKTLRMLEASRGNVDWKRKFPSMMKLQFHIMGEQMTFAMLKQWTSDLTIDSEILRYKRQQAGARMQWRSVSVLIKFCLGPMTLTFVCCWLLPVVLRAR